MILSVLQNAILTKASELPCRALSCEKNGLTGMHNTPFSCRNAQHALFFCHPLAECSVLLRHSTGRMPPDRTNLANPPVCSSQSPCQSKQIWKNHHQECSFNLEWQIQPTWVPFPTSLACECTCAKAPWVAAQREWGAQILEPIHWKVQLPCALSWLTLWARELLREAQAQPQSHRTECFCQSVLALRTDLRHHCAEGILLIVKTMVMIDETQWCERWEG
jgi:hypothetical protein